MDLATQPSWNIAQDAGELDFLPGKSAYYFTQDPRSARLEGDPDVSNSSGDFFTYRLQATMRAIRPTVESLRAKLMNRRVHVIGTYQDNVQRFVPYMRISIKDDSGARRADKQGYTLTGATRLIMPGPGVGGNIAVVPPPTGGEALILTPGSAATVNITTTSSSYSHLLTAGQWLIGWEVRSTSNQTVSAGITGGGTELGGPIYLSTPQIWVGQGNMVPTFSDINIYFSGLTGTNTIKLWILTA